MSFGKRYLRIGVLIFLMVGIVVCVGNFLRKKGTDTRQEVKVNAKLDFDAKRQSFHVMDEKMLAEWRLLHATPGQFSKRDLKRYYDLRAFIGAPPRIPHLVESQREGGEACLICHLKGGYVPKYEAYAPLTPHPKFLNCQQCHVQEKTKDLFRPTNWETLTPPSIKRPSLPGPPPIPHTLEMRENCLACHAGPAAPLEIRTPHPERSQCLQCHVIQKKVS